MTTPLLPLPEDTDRNPVGDTRPQPPITSTPPSQAPVQPRIPTNQRPPLRTGHIQPTGTPAPRPTMQTGSMRPVQPAPRRRENALVLPWWSILAMLVLVLVIAFGLVAVLLSLGNRPPTTEVTPIIRIITALPTQPNALQFVPTTAPLIQVGGQGTPPQQLALEGPTLAFVAFTPTPLPITIGSTIVVEGVDADQLNVRDAAGVQGTTILFRVDEGTLFTIIGGPMQADNFTWWQIQDVLNPANTGWAVANFLQVTTGGQ